ncbi:MAG: hypothetical protein GX879_02435, partial [Bacteroidales bacterium]|nr:hypothetical protein [Bacteroidales bacterium]
MKNLSINQKLIISFILICCVSAVMYVITRIDLNIANNNDIVLRSNNGLNTNYINDIIYIDFETKKHILPHSFSAISKTNSLSGQNSTFINDQNDFSATITLDLDEINIEKLNKVHLNYWYYPTKEKINASVVVSIFDKESGEQIFWDCQRIVSDNIKPDYWHNKGKTFNIPDSIKKENSNLRIYALGGMDNSKVYFDDFEIAFA